MTDTMRQAIIESLSELDELEAQRELLPSDMIRYICDEIEELSDLLPAPIRASVRNEIKRIFRANTQERVEVDAAIKTTRGNISAMVKSYGATVKAAGFSANYMKASICADWKRLKLDAVEDPDLAKYIKPKAHSCRIIRSKS